MLNHYYILPVIELQIYTYFLNAHLYDLMSYHFKVEHPGIHFYLFHKFFIEYQFLFSPSKLPSACKGSL